VGTMQKDSRLVVSPPAFVVAIILEYGHSNRDEMKSKCCFDLHLFYNWEVEKWIFICDSFILMDFFIVLKLFQWYGHFKDFCFLLVCCCVGRLFLFVIPPWMYEST
jgi:hypothetical protein